MPVLSNPSGDTPASAPLGPVTLDNEGFEQLWCRFTEQAIKVANEPMDSNNYHQKVVAILDTLQKLIFGVDEGRKAIAVRNGALQLIVQLSNTLSQSDDVTMAALKATKCCVVKNPIGRSYCRSAGTIKWLKEVLRPLVKTQDLLKAKLVEECLTTLAAICLGDDLNALQGAKEFRCIVDEASSRYPKEDYPSLYRMIVYLGALFDAMDKEQSKLLERGEVDSLFETVRQAELLLTEKTKPDADKAEATYSHALEKLDDLASVTNLLDTLLCNLHEKRAAVRALAQNWDGCLEDIETCLSKFEPSPDMTIRLQTQRAHALQALGRVVDAKEAIGKAIMVNPQSEELQEKLRQLNLQ